MRSANGKERFIPITRIFTKRITGGLENKTGHRSGRITSGVRRPAENFRLASLLSMTGVVLILGMIPVNSAFAVSPFSIDGNVPDAITGIFMADDPSGSVQELGATNGNSTKLGPT